MSDPVRYHWKGKYVSKKVYEQMLRRSENGKKNKGRVVAPEVEKAKGEKKPEEADITSQFPVKGARVVDLKYMSQHMYCDGCNGRLFTQNIVHETIQGLGSYFDIKCNSCPEITKVRSGPMKNIPGSNKKVFEINVKLPIGAIRAGIGHSQVDTFLSTFEIPVLSKNSYKNQERLVGPFLEEVAKTSCEHAIELERALTLENLDKLKKMLPPGTPDDFLVYTKEINGEEVEFVRVFVSFDFAWSQRSNGYNYDSLNGYGCLIGMLSGMVLDYVSFNRKCRQCEYNEQNGTAKEHDCRLNFHGSAKSMEAEGAHKLVIGSQLLKDANVEVGVFIADNDSSSFNTIQNAATYTIIKQSDMNHSTKGVKNSLFNINSKINQDPDRELQQDTINILKRYFSYAVKQNVGDLEKMRAAIKNIPDHAFDRHDNCGSWCTAKEEKENYVGLQMKNAELYKQLKALFDKLAENATKFLMAASSQANESLNNSMCSKAPKRICYSTSESCDYRFACTVVQKNYGEAYIQSIFHILGFETTVRLAERIQRTTERAIKRKAKETSIDEKKKRIQRTQKRSQVKYRTDKKEETSYSSHMALFDITNFNTPPPIPACTNNENLFAENSNEKSSDSNNSTVFESNDTKIVFFDLETGGFDMLKDDVLQICLKCGEQSYSSYITPTRPIHPKATEAHKLTRINKNLYKNGEQVVTSAKASVVCSVLQFLRNLGKKCILVAHNCDFDSKRLIILVKSCALLDHFKSIIVGFTDTLSLFRKKIVDVSDHKLTTLAACKLQIPCSEAHDATFDVNILEKLAKKFLSLDDLLAINGTIDGICTNIDKKVHSRKNISSFLPLKDDISKAMLQRLSEETFTYGDLIDAYLKSEECAKELLQGKVNGKVTIIKKQEILDTILEHLKVLIYGD